MLKNSTKVLLFPSVNSLNREYRDMHSALHVANFLLGLARDTGKELTPMQLIKLVYLCHGWMLGLYGKVLVKEEIEAWAYGPVIRDLYDEVKEYRSAPIANDLTIYPNNKDFDEKEKSVMKQTFDLYSHCSGPALSRLTHKSGSPWSITYKTQGQNETISNDIIQDYFGNLIKEYSK